MDEVEDNVLPNKEDVDEDEQEPEHSNKHHSLHVSRKAISKYGTTEGCPASNAINRRGHVAGRIGYNHSSACRERDKADMQNDQEYKRLMYKHEVHQEAGNLEMLTEAQVRERHHNVLRAIAAIEKKIHETIYNMEQQFIQTLFKDLIAKMEVAEVYSPSRVIDMARQMGLRAGWALDSATQDVDGREWDFNQLAMRNRAVRKVFEDKPLLLVGSPTCTAFSQLNNINDSRMDPLEVKRRMDYGRRHFEFCVKLYNLQREAGRYFLHGHPANASSWHEKCVRNLMNKHGVTKVIGDQCRYGLVATEN